MIERKISRIDYKLDRKKSKRHLLRSTILMIVVSTFITLNLPLTTAGSSWLSYDITKNVTADGEFHLFYNAGGSHSLAGHGFPPFDPANIFRELYLSVHKNQQLTPSGSQVTNTVYGADTISFYGHADNGDLSSTAQSTTAASFLNGLSIGATTGSIFVTIASQNSFGTTGSTSAFSRYPPGRPPGTQATADANDETTDPLIIKVPFHVNDNPTPCILSIILADLRVDPIWWDSSFSFGSSLANAQADASWSLLYPDESPVYLDGVGINDQLGVNSHDHSYDTWNDLNDPGHSHSSFRIPPGDYILKVQGYHTRAQLGLVVETNQAGAKTYLNGDTFHVWLRFGALPIPPLKPGNIGIPSQTLPPSENNEQST